MYDINIIKVCSKKEQKIPKCIKNTVIKQPVSDTNTLYSDKSQQTSMNAIIRQHIYIYLHRVVISNLESLNVAKGASKLYFTSS